MTTTQVRENVNPVYTTDARITNRFGNMMDDEHMLNFLSTIQIQSRRQIMPAIEQTMSIYL